MALHSYDGFTDRDWERDVDGVVKLGIIGLGWFGREMAIPITERSDCLETTVVVSGSREKAESVAAEHDTIEHALTYEEFHDGAASDAYDAVYVATPNALHLPHVEAAADLGKDVLCEKPLEASVERAEHVVEACEGTDATLMTAYRVHFDPLTRRVRELLEEGFLGDVVQVDGAFDVPHYQSGDPDQWRFDPDLAGGGALYDIGIYPLNTSRFLLGEDPVAVQARVVPEYEVLDGLDVHASFQLEYPGDVIASCRTSYDAADNYLTIVGTDGRLHIDGAFGGEERTLTVERDGIETQITVEADELFEEFEYFANRVLAGEPVEPDGEHGLEDMRLMEAVYEADERGERVEC